MIQFNIHQIISTIEPEMESKANPDQNIILEQIKKYDTQPDCLYFAQRTSAETVHG